MDLWKIENWVVNQTGNQNIKSFEDFGHGSFVKFIIHDRELLQIVQTHFEEQNQSFGGHSQGFSKEDIENFVYQCSSKTKSKVSHLFLVQHND